MKPHVKQFEHNCARCPRLAAFLTASKQKFPDYWCAPVPPFGDVQVRVLIVGLAPGLHGANATGRPFTGDHAGLILYRYLHQFGFASAPTSQTRTDGLQLHNARITNAVKCVPPENKPTNLEIKTCNAFLRAELHALSQPTVLLALGAIAHTAILQAFELKRSALRFQHGAEHALPYGHVLINSYHCSRYNTQTKRLTEAMFAAIFTQVTTVLARLTKVP